jgi:hypothetical protein
MEERAIDPVLLGVDPDSFGDSVMAADAAMDAAQTFGWLRSCQAGSDWR